MKNESEPENLDTRSTLKGSVERGSWADIVRDMGATESTTTAMKNASKGKECKFAFESSFSVSGIYRLVLKDIHLAIQSVAIKPRYRVQTLLCFWIGSFYNKHYVYTCTVPSLPHPHLLLLL
jgi:hypothetical protein